MRIKLAGFEYRAPSDEFGEDGVPGGDRHDEFVSILDRLDADDESSDEN